MSENQPMDAWAKRFEAVGRAQARYLWVLLVVTLFYLALQNAPSQSVTVPIIDLTLNSDAVLAVGGPSISFLLIALAGTLLEWGHVAKKAFGNDWRDHVERHDLNPTVFDFAHYTVRDKSRVLDILAYFLLYPTFLAVALAEAASLLIWLWRNQAPARLVLLILGISFWLWAARLILVEVWWRRIKRVPALWRKGSSRAG